MKQNTLIVMIFLIAFSTSSMFIAYSGSKISNKYRRITVDNIRNPDTLTNYQVFINVTYDSDMQPDFDDLRFTWYDETIGQEVDIDYWLDKYVASEYALVWIEVPLIRALGQEVLYMYYGDPDVVSGSNGAETFVFFDDFSTNTTSEYEISRNQKGEISWDVNGWLLLNASVLEGPGRSANVMLRHKTAQIDEAEENYWLETNGKAFGNGVLDYYGVMKEYKHDPLGFYPNAYSANAKIYGVPSNSCRLQSTWETIAEFDEGTSLPTSAKNKWYRIGLGTSSNGTVVGKFYNNDYGEITTLANHTIHSQNEWRVSLTGSKNRELDYPTTLCVYFDYIKVRKFTDPEPSCLIAPEEPLPATVNLDPDTLNLKSNGQWITAYITLPEGYNVEDIVLETVEVEGISAAWSEIQDGVYMVKFDRATVQASVTNEPDYESAPKFYDLLLIVTGELVDGIAFEGSDTITVIKK